ncbi:hypothetical protein FHT02_003285 [Sphingomonas xinjiangensis]|uniref:Uncharacterized protein n=1 Tax=Sphingomonas xinjiangensis TaxID=643568 RepID=A0A840YIV6_9SPHN|nr:hypothetical protein [Sphingomonas xinjiangensis]
MPSSDKLHQEVKLAASALGYLSSAAEIVSDKTAETSRLIVARENAKSWPFCQPQVLWGGDSPAERPSLLRRVRDYNPTTK